MHTVFQLKGGILKQPSLSVGNDTGTSYLLCNTPMSSGSLFISTTALPLPEFGHFFFFFFFFFPFVGPVCPQLNVFFHSDKHISKSKN